MTLIKDLQNLLQEKKSEVTKLEQIIADLERSTEQTHGKKENLYITILDFGRASVTTQNKEITFFKNDVASVEILASKIIAVFDVNKYNFIVYGSEDKALHNYGRHLMREIKANIKELSE